MLLKKNENIALKCLNDSRAFIKNSNYVHDIYKNIKKYNPNKKRKMLIIFDDMIADMLSNKKFNPTVTEIFIRGRKLNVSHDFIKQSYLLYQKILD